jgi:hypothetical protein
MFQSKGHIPEWKMVYDDLLADADYGMVITYDDLDAALGRRFVDNRSPLYRARTHLGEERSRWLETVPTVGYRVIEANEHMGVANRHKRKATRQLGMMVTVAEVTDLSRLTPSELSSFDAQQKINAMLYLFALHHERRLQHIESVLGITPKGMGGVA